MSKIRKRRKVKKNPPHQIMKSSGENKGINWTRIAVITVGILIALSMVLSLFVVPGVSF